jgi:hypothetical protein
MKSLFFEALVIAAIMLSSCSNDSSGLNKPQEKQNNPPAAEINESHTEEVFQVTMTPQYQFLTGIKINISGDFNGDGQKENAWSVITSEAVFQQKEYGFSLFFSDKNVAPFQSKTFSTSDSTIILINEGDLNDVPGDEISIYLPPMNSLVYNMTTYTYHEGAWKQFGETILIPTAFYGEQDLDPAKIIYKENGKVYYDEVDVNSEEFKLEKKHLKLKSF